jgi:hypothetical protein
MTIERIFPRDEAQFVDVLRHQLKGIRSAVVHAGHFLLHVDERTGKAMPCIAEVMEGDENLRREVGYFPLLSWSLACRALQAIERVDFYLLVIVNDWQYVADPELRKGFYEEWQSLPPSFITAARAIAPRIKFLKPAGAGSSNAQTPFFSERSLRNRYNRRLRAMLRDGRLPPGLSIGQDPDAPEACHLRDAVGGRLEVYCPGKDADCSKEIAQVIDEAYRQTACEAFVNFYPAVCQPFVEAGSELPVRLFGTGVDRVINIALPATGVLREADLIADSEIAVHNLRDRADEPELRAGGY